MSHIHKYPDETPAKRTRHKYPSAAYLKKLLNTEGSLSAAAAEAGGKLIQVPMLKVRRVGRGCGSPTPVSGTSGKAPCGCFVTDLQGVRSEHLCYYCEEAHNGR